MPPLANGTRARWFGDPGRRPGRGLRLGRAAAPGRRPAPAACIGRPAPAARARRPRDDRDHPADHAVVRRRRVVLHRRRPGHRPALALGDDGGGAVPHPPAARALMELVLGLAGSAVLLLGLSLASIGLYGMLRRPPIFEQLHAAGLVTGSGVIL